VDIFLDMNVVIYLLCGFALILGGVATALSVLNDNGSQQGRSFGGDPEIGAGTAMGRLGKREEVARVPTPIAPTSRRS
jgi:hypothetical protein